MASIAPHAAPLRLACHQFSDAEIEALRSLLGLLAPYLRRPWEVVPASAAQITLLLVNLDHPEPQAPRGDVQQVGCAVKPRLKPVGCIHRPLRASELLAVLSEAATASADSNGSTTAAAMPSPPATAGETWRYHLRAWPLDLDHWPRPHWRVLAAITRGPVSISEIAERSELPPDEIEALIRQLSRQQLLDTTLHHHHAPRPAAAARPVWRSLASRVGQLLGLAR